MTTDKDEIIEKIRMIREEHAASLGYDVLRIARSLQAEEQQSGKRFVTRPPRKPSPPVKSSSV